MRLRVTPMRLTDSVAALTGEHAKEVERAERYAAAGEFQRAREIYEKTYPGLDTKDPGVRFMYCRALEMRWTEQFETGEWVDVSPTHDVAGWAAWYVPFGQWKRDPPRDAASTQPADASVAASPLATMSRDGWATALMNMSFGGRWEMRIVAEGVEPQPLKKNMFAGITVAYFDADTVFHVLTGGGSEMLYRYDKGEWNSRKAIQVGNEFEMRVRVWDRKYSVDIDGRTIWDRANLPSYVDREGALIGVTAGTSNGPAAFRFKTIEIRKLQTPAGN
jgi:hypothetical protein